MSCKTWRRAGAAFMFGFCLAMAWRISCAQPLDRSKADSPFANVLEIERVHLAEPMTVEVDGRARSETDLVLLIVRLAEPERFLPRSSPNEATYLGNAHAQFLFPPIVSPVIAIVAPANDSPDRLALWTTGASSPPSRRPPSSLDDRQKAAQRAGPAQFVSLETAAKLGRINLSVRPIANRKALMAYAEERAAKLGERQ